MHLTRTQLVFKMPMPGMKESKEHKQERRKLDTAAAESERLRRLYDTVLSNTPDLVYVFDLNHRFTYANESLLRMWGKAWDDAIGKNCLELGYEPWHAAMHDREIEQVIATKRPIRGEVPFTGTNGRRFYDYIFAPVLGPTGEVKQSPEPRATSQNEGSRKTHSATVKKDSGHLWARRRMSFIA